ncbi:MAG TPA: penicillin-binding protein 2 [Alphaproteobacteria bacterium]|nr:penicillin-binding protein 2 [Alphaproteobacteria bacterium]
MTDYFSKKSESINGTQSRLLGQSKARLFVVIAVFLIGYMAISLRLIDLTLLRQTAAEKMAENAESPAKPAVAAYSLRGTIKDRNGELMATSLSMASVYADALLVENPKNVAAELAALLPDEKESDLAEKLASKRRFVWIARNITPRQQYAINALGHPGIGFKEESKRIYPHGRLTSHVLGYTDVDGKGIAGVEKQHDTLLTEGEDDLTLSIDLRIQHLMHRELSSAMKKFSAKAGIGMVMDVNNGEIIAMVSLPDFDPYQAGAADDDARFNRATLGVYEMGSTFKIFPLAAALDSGDITFNTTIDATEPIKFGRFRISDYHAKKRPLSVPEIFIYSSNIGTARIAQALGEDGLKDFYGKLGFFDRAPVDLPERGLPLYPKPWRDINTLTASYGHGIAVSPVHLMRAAAALVNGGILIAPHLTPQKGDTPKGSRVIKAATTAKIRQLMELVVAGGTGSKARVEGYAVGGKTGTADKTKGRGYSKDARLSSFIGVYPIDAPRYAVLAILDEPQGIKETYNYATGGWTAAPVVGRVIEQMAPLYQIAPEEGGRPDIVEMMSPYLKETKEGKSIVAVGTDR